MGRTKIQIMKKPYLTQSSGCIAIGDGAIATEPRELAIKVTGWEGRTIMSEAEADVFSSVLRRIKFDVLTPKEESRLRIACSSGELLLLRGLNQVIAWTQHRRNAASATTLGMVEQEITSILTAHSKPRKSISRDFNGRSFDE